MMVGHAAVAVGAAKTTPRVNVGWLIFAALLADVLLGIFVLAGVEHVHVPADFASRHYLTFTFPYSHGLLSLAVWGGLFGFMISRMQPTADRRKVFVVVTALVLSHFFLDGLVHVVGLPLAGESSPKFGLALWSHLPLELTLESLMAALAAAMFFRTARVSARSRWGISIFLAVLTAITWTQLWMVQPPAQSQLIANWVVGLPILSAIAYTLDRNRVRGGASS